MSTKWPLLDERSQFILAVYSWPERSTIHKYDFVAVKWPLLRLFPFSRSKSTQIARRLAPQTRRKRDERATRERRDKEEEDVLEDVSESEEKRDGFTERRKTDARMLSIKRIIRLER